MYSKLLESISTKYQLKKPNGFLNYRIIKANGLTFITDPLNPRLRSGEMAVYPFFDEASQLLKIVKKITDERRKKFDLTIDPFCGGGHSGLPVEKNLLTKRLILRDINPRAIILAKANTELNRLEKYTKIERHDILIDGLPDSDAPGNTLYLANPPFGLKTKGVEMAVMLDGGENGLKLTNVFTSAAIKKTKPGDIIIGIAYSRIGGDGKIELDKILNNLVLEHGGRLELSLIKGEKLWRKYKGEKEQLNPMIINEETFALAANPKRPEEIAAYKNAARFHNRQGYNKLGYFFYIIRK